MNLRLMGGALGVSTPVRSSSVVKGQTTFTDVLRGKIAAHDKQTPNLSVRGPYIVEKKEKFPELAIEIPEVNGLFNLLQQNAIICHFNGYWPKSEELNAWIYLN